MANWPNPFIEQRANPFILRDGSDYYFIASVPEYDRLEIRRADSLEGLRAADPLSSGANRKQADEPAYLGAGNAPHQR